MLLLRQLRHRTNKGTPWNMIPRGLTCNHAVTAMNRLGPDPSLWPKNGTVKLAESKLGGDRVGRVNGRDEDASRRDLRRPSLPS
jgi:hypothetical protein